MPEQKENISDKVLFEVKDLTVSFHTDEGIVKAVNGISYTVNHGKTLGIVGESGSGKSVACSAILQLLPKTARVEGSILLQDKGDNIREITKLKPNSREMGNIRGGEIAMIFQEPMSSFSPVHTVGNQLMEAILQHRNVTKPEAREIAIDMLDRVGISNPAQRFRQYAFELSGGMRQRAMIAIALSSSPSLLIADEPTTALDVTIQAQVLELMTHLQAEYRMAIIFVTHDIGVIAQIADEIVVMYLGYILERGTTREVINNPQHPYTQKLLEAIPRLDQLGGRLTAVGGDIPGPFEFPSGCPFHTRCQQMITDRCDTTLLPVVTFSQTHSASCFLYE
jgi:peptide/nickel transport system ATP-binding protein